MYKVHWAGAARQELADVWLRASSRLKKLITVASNGIDMRLKDDPDGVGESRPGSERVLFVFPLGVRYKVDHASRRVRVLRVWNYNRTI